MSAYDNGHSANLTQVERFKEAARDLKTDDDEARFDERVRKLVKHNPVEKPK